MSKNIDKKIYSNFLKDLENLGLNDKESRVYLSLLRLGEVGSSKIINDTRLHGQFVYLALSALEEKGLVHHVTKRGRKKFAAQNPNMLSLLIEDKKTIVDRLVPELQAMLALPKGEDFEIFQGIESFKAQEFFNLEHAQDKSDVLMIGGSGDKFSRIMARNFNGYEKIRNKKEIRIRYLGSQEQKHELNVLSQARERFDYRFLPGSHSGLIHTNIWPDRVCFNIYGHTTASIMIVDENMAKSHKELFEILWSLGTK